MTTVFRSIFTFIVTSADTLTMAMLSLNHLARGAVERTVVVEQKAVKAAALSELDSITTMAERLQEIDNAADGISKEAFERATVFLNTYEAKRKQEIAGQPLYTKRAVKSRPAKGRNKSKETIDKS